MFNVYVVDLSIYNRGGDNGRWLNLPMDESDLDKELEDITGGIHEYGLMDYETDIDEYYMRESESIYHLNELAELAENTTPQLVSAAIYFRGRDAETCELERCIQDMFVIPYDCSTPEESVGRWFIDELGSLEVPDEIENYFDYERYGRDILLENYHYTFLDKIYVEGY